jgi:hypothetical protein
MKSSSEGSPLSESFTAPPEFERLPVRAARRRWTTRVLLTQAGAVGMALIAALCKSHFQQFTSNQQTYLVRAVAAARASDILSADWFVQTTDPVRIFTFVARVLSRWGGDSSLIACNVVLGAVLIFSLAGIATSACRAASGPAARGALPSIAWVAFFGSMWIVPSGFMHRLLFDGVAGQQAYLPYFQPSNLAVLLLLAVWLALSGANLCAVFVAAIAAWLHPTYTLSAAFFTLGVAVATAWQGRDIRRAIVLLLGGATLLAQPTLIVLADFSPTSRELARQAAELLVTKRMPHHASIGAWADGVALLQCAPVFAALSVSRGRQQAMLWVWAVIALLATASVAWLGRPELNLLFPWRATVWLIPACSALVLGAAIARCQRFELASPLARVCAPILCAVLLIAGVLELRRKVATEDFLGVNLARSIALHDRQHWTLLSPVDWEGVRLNTPAAIYVDFKSHPYKDVEVLEWARRVDQARAIYAQSGPNACRELLELLSAEPRLGFVLAPHSAHWDSCSFLAAGANDVDGTVYRVRGRTAL